MDTWTDEQRAIFEYRWTDGTPRFADPLAIRRALLEVTDWKIDAIKQCNGGPIEKERANRDLAQIAIEVFGLPPFDPLTGKGATEAMALAIYNAFCDDYEKKNLGGLPSQTLSPSTT